MVKRKIVSCILTIAVALVFVVPCVQSDVYGTTSISISGSDKINCGDEFTVTVEFTGDNTARVEGQVGYDNSVLEYVSGGSSDSGEGFVDLSKSGGDGTVTFEIVFKAIKGGTTGIDVSSSAIYDNNKNLIDNCASTKVIEITGDKNSDNDEAVQESSTVAATDEVKNGGSVFSGKTLGIGACALVIIIILIVVAIKRKKVKR